MSQPPAPESEEVVEEVAPNKVVLWRADRLIKAGYDEEAALLLAESTVDLHRAVGLLERGCPPTTALLILL